MRRQQVLIIGIAFQEYKMQVIAKAYDISTNEEKSELSAEEEQQTHEAKQKLQRSPNVLVLDEEGIIILQGPELSEKEYVNFYFKYQPVSFLDRILGNTEKIQREIAAEKYRKYKKLLED